MDSNSPNSTASQNVGFSVTGLTGELPCSVLHIHIVQF